MNNEIDLFYTELTNFLQAKYTLIKEKELEDGSVLTKWLPCTQTQHKKKPWQKYLENNEYSDVKEKGRKFYAQIKKREFEKAKKEESRIYYHKVVLTEYFLIVIYQADSKVKIYLQEEKLILFHKRDSFFQKGKKRILFITNYNGKFVFKSNKEIRGLSFNTKSYLYNSTFGTGALNSLGLFILEYYLSGIVKFSELDRYNLSKIPFNVKFPSLKLTKQAKNVTQFSNLLNQFPISENLFRRIKCLFRVKELVDEIENSQVHLLYSIDWSSYNPENGRASVFFLSNRIHSKMSKKIPAKERETYYLLEDYIKMAEEMNVKIDLSIKSYNRLKNIHDDLAEKIVNKNFVDDGNRVYQLFNFKKDYSDKLKVLLLSSKIDLQLESKKMHHCVASYWNNVLRQHSIIYHIEYQEQPYTLEICIKDFEMKIEQLKGKYNTQPPKSLTTILRKLFNKSNIKNTTPSTCDFFQIKNISQ